MTSNSRRLSNFLPRLALLAGALLAISLCGRTARAVSNIDPDHRFAWGENIGWTNWRHDARNAGDGVIVHPAFVEGFVWGENVGWINVGNGGGAYGNNTGFDFGVNIDPFGDLSDLAWGENIGWVNFGGGALADPPQPAHFDGCRFSGYAWGENVGWINLDDAIDYVAGILSSVAVVTYDGDTLLSTGGNATADADIVASLRDDEGNVLDINNEKVIFTLNAEGVEPVEVTALSHDGVAHVIEPLEPAIYSIEVSVACPSLTGDGILVVYNPEGGFATGGGWIVPEENGENTHPNVRANFGFVAKYRQGEPTGHIEFRYSDGYVDLKSTSIELLVITGGRIAQFQGWARVNGEEGHWFFAKAIDNGEPGVADELDIKTWAPGSDPGGDPAERAGGVLQGGNIVVHAR